MCHNCNFGPQLGLATLDLPLLKTELQTAHIASMKAQSLAVRKATNVLRCKKRGLIQRGVGGLAGSLTGNSSTTGPSLPEPSRNEHSNVPKHAEF